MRRLASVIHLRPEHEARYRELHAAVWPQVERTLRDAHVTNYSIFLRDGILFAYMEYVGDDWAADSARIAADDTTQQWWRLTDPCQRPFDTAAGGARWVDAAEVYHLD